MKGRPEMFPVRLRAALAVVFLSSGCAQWDSYPTVSVGTTVNDKSQRLSDTRITADQPGLQGIQDRLTALRNAGVPGGSYAYAKAQCWLETARTQYFENDRSGYVEQALERSSVIIQALEADHGANIQEEVPLIAGSHRLRDDLWRRLDAQKTRPGFTCAAQIVACAEVRLVRAGHADEQTGWRQATPHIAMVEDAIEEAAQQAAQCPAGTTPAVSLIPRNAAPAVPDLPSVPLPSGGERMVLIADALFPLDQSELDPAQRGSGTRLMSLVHGIKRYRHINVITIVGYTDRLGSDDHNLKLSLARASAIGEFLAQRGAIADRVVVVGKGKADPSSATCSEALPRAELISCLQPDRRVEIEIQGVLE